MSSVNETIANYIAAWNETGSARRRSIIERTWSADGSYLDARREGEGHAAIEGMIAAVQQRFPGYRFRLCSGIEAHHDRVRFSWCAGAQRPHHCSSAAPTSRPSPMTAGSRR
jgi:hypothetical protein